MSGLSVVKEGTGVFIEYGDVSLGLDVGHPDITTLLSHAHFDHLGRIKLAREVITTQGTLDVFRARGGRVKWKCTVGEYDKTMFHEEALITPIDAGHVLGSAMFLIEFNDNMRLLYTGDFNNVDSIVHKAASAVDADVLVMESTYGTPEWVFPEREQTHSQVLAKAEEVLSEGRVPLFKAYSLGKAQEAIGLLQREGFTVMTGNSAIDSVSMAYRKHGCRLDYLPTNRETVRKLVEEDVVIISSSPGHMRRQLVKLLGSMITRDLESKIVEFDLSGWTLTEQGRQGFPLSAHADFPSLIDFAKEVDPKIAYCFTANASSLAKHLSNEGINAVPLE